MTIFDRTRANLLQSLESWQNSRWPWGIVALTMVTMVLIAHYVFQDWLHMLPCEQCVYIRFGNLVVALGSLIALINPKRLLLKLLGYGISFYGLVYTGYCATLLIRIHHAVHSDDPTAMFGLQGCSTDPHYPLGLPLERWAPDWFMPTGDCGYDAPVVPDGIDLGSIQAWLIHWYQSYDGWYLIPQWQFLSMAECCLLAVVIVAIVLITLLMGTLSECRHQP